MATEQSAAAQIQPNAYVLARSNFKCAVITVRESRCEAAFVTLSDGHLDVAAIRWLCHVLTQFADAYVDKAADAAS